MKYQWISTMEVKNTVSKRPVFISTRVSFFVDVLQFVSFFAFVLNLFEFFFLYFLVDLWEVFRVLFEVKSTVLLSGLCLTIKVYFFVVVFSVCIFFCVCYESVCTFFSVLGRFFVVLRRCF